MGGRGRGGRNPHVRNSGRGGGRSAHGRVDSMGCLKEGMMADPWLTQVASLVSSNRLCAEEARKDFSMPRSPPRPHGSGGCAADFDGEERSRQGGLHGGSAPVAACGGEASGAEDEASTELPPEDVYLEFRSLLDGKRNSLG